MSEELKALIAANKQHLQLLNQQVKLLEDEVAGDSGYGYWEAGKYPYFYGAVDQADEPGIPCVDTDAPGGPPSVNPAGPVSAEVDNRTFEGRIKIQSDAPFVVTHILTCQRLDIGKVSGDVVTTYAFPGLQNAFVGIQSGAPDPFTFGANAGNLASAPDVDLGFIEEGSGRQLFQAERLDVSVAGNSNNKEQLLSPTFFNSTRLFRSGVGSDGHGPNFAFELTTETLLPPNDVVRVLVRPTFYNNFSLDASPTEPIAWRVYVAFLGYKIFGD